MSPEQVAERLQAEAGLPVNAANDNGEIVSVNYPRSIRQVLAELTDDEAPILDDIFYALEEGEQRALFAEADQIEDLAERVDWTRKLIQARGPAARSTPVTPPQPLAQASIPAALQPTFNRLTPAEREIAVRIAKRLDMGTLAELGASLLALPLEAQVEKVRRMIQAFEQRESSTAQRAVFSVLKGDAA
jgi:hypothetical protein